MYNSGAFLVVGFAGRIIEGIGAGMLQTAGKNILIVMTTVDNYSLW